MISRTGEGKWKPVGGLWRSVRNKFVCKKAAEEKPPSPKSVLHMMPSKVSDNRDPVNLHRNMSTQSWSRIISHRMGFSYSSGSSILRVGTGVQSHAPCSEVFRPIAMSGVADIVSCKPNLLQTKFAAPNGGTDCTDWWNSPKPSRAVSPLDVLHGQPQL